MLRVCEGTPRLRCPPLGGCALRKLPEGLRTRSPIGRWRATARESSVETMAQGRGGDRDISLRGICVAACTALLIFALVLLLVFGEHGQVKRGRLQDVASDMYSLRFFLKDGGFARRGAEGCVEFLGLRGFRYASQADPCAVYWLPRGPKGSEKECLLAFVESALPTGSDAGPRGNRVYFLAVIDGRVYTLNRARELEQLGTSATSFSPSMAREIAGMIREGRIEQFGSPGDEAE